MFNTCCCLSVARCVLSIVCGLLMVVGRCLRFVGSRCLSCIVCAPYALFVVYWPLLGVCCVLCSFSVLFGRYCMFFIEWACDCWVLFDFRCVLRVACWVRFVVRRVLLVG